MTGVVTVTPAAAVDRTYRVPALVPGIVNRAEDDHHELSGKGVNVARAIAQTDVPVRAVVPLGPADLAGVAGDPVVVPVPISRDVRVNTTVIEADGRTTKVNAPPTPLEPAEWDALSAAAVDAWHAVGSGWIAICGSIPRIAGTGALAPFEELIERAADAGARIALDSSGEALQRALQVGARIDLIKPNTHELAEATGQVLRTVGDVVAAAQQIREAGVRTVYVSMGADGALVLDASGYRVAVAAAPALVNTVGAGDASLAGFLAQAARGRGLDDAAAAAASWGALAVSQVTTILAGPASAPPARVSIPAEDTPLSEPALTLREAS
ncbi:1-phosphofructokinase family hexose kinase [Microbacterium sp. EF45047]|uniref:1-phosphofructokinase family hexose kinase n=1 Tax=Microbacterium sp. EF45047 TaxID=2809708 RepID=UPI002349B989|nr:hexose kinase [Microbacterium sp. EF45047]WCM55939.1 hexose kinase [Microbacterium sp. EF45047]